MISGHVTICKVYSDGTKETVLDKANLVTAGLGSSYLDILQNAGSISTVNYSPGYFQAGTSAIGYTSVPARQASSTFYQLSAPFHFSAYGVDTNLNISQEYRGFNASTEDTGVSYPSLKDYTELLNTSAPLSSCIFSGSDQYFATIPDGRISKFYMDSFECELILDENTGNGKDITEIGLFAKNPKGLNQDSPLLMAYRSFTAISKTSSFSLAVNWTIGFLGVSNNIDNYYTGGPGVGQRGDDYVLDYNK